LQVLVQFKKFSIVKISGNQSQSNPNEVINPHPLSKCLKYYAFTMKKRYGNEINWFRIMGGMTVAISINPNIFKKNM
jgi:hypothetical protein